MATVAGPSSRSGSGVVPLEFELCDVIEVHDGLITSVTILADWQAVLPKLTP